MAISEFHSDFTDLGMRLNEFIQSNKTAFEKKHGCKLTLSASDVPDLDGNTVHFVIDLSAPNMDKLR